MILEIVSRGDGPPDRRGRGMPGGGGGPMGPPGMDMGGNAATVEISIPGPKVGLIIGKLSLCNGHKLNLNWMCK